MLTGVSVSPPPCRGSSFRQSTLQEILRSPVFKKANGLDEGAPLDPKMLAITPRDVAKLFIKFFITLVTWTVTGASLVLTDMWQFERGFEAGGLVHLKALYESGDAQTVYCRLQGDKSTPPLPSSLTRLSAQCVPALS